MCVGAVVVVTSVLACRQLVGIHDDPPEDLSPSACGLPIEGACGTCASTNCCAEATACAASSTCATYATCLARCNGDLPCRSECERTAPLATEPQASRLRACLATSCESECTLPCGGFVDFLAAPDAANACLACARNQCPGAVRCGRSADCTLANRCVDGCRTADCFQECASHVDAAFADAPLPEDAGGFQQFASEPCFPVCGVGSDWACVGRVVWPRASAAQANLRIHGEATLDVDVCTNADCSKPFASGALSDGGLLEVAVPMTIGTLGPGIGGYVLARPASDDGGAEGAEPTPNYWGFPLSQATYDFGVVAPSRRMVAAILDLAGEKSLPLHGHIYITASDCRFEPAHGVVVAVTDGDEHTHTYYFDADGTAHAADRTFASGIAGVANVPIGVRHVEIRPAGLAVVSHSYYVVVREGAATQLYAFPTPPP
jgi:hypothetical protein